MSSPAGIQSVAGNADLLRAAGNGDSAAWEELVSRYGRVVRATVAAFRLQEADAADAVQNTWVRAFERWHTIRDPERLGGWLMTTAGRESLALIRRRRREIPVDVAATEPAALGPGPEAQALADDVRREVAAVVDGLTGRRRQLVDALFYRPDPSYADLSRDCDIPVGSIGPTRGRLLRDLRSSLEQRGIDAVA